MKKRFKNLTIANIILLFLYGLLRSIGNVDTGLSAILFRLSAVVFIFISLIIFILIIIFGIIDCIKQKEKCIKKNLCVLMFILLLINIGFPIILHYTEIFMLNNAYVKFNNLSHNMIDKIKNTDNNKYVYLFNDLLVIDNTFKNGPLGNEIDNSSYIAYYDGKARVCISDGNYNIYGYEDNLKIERIARGKQICDYSFEDIGEKPYQHNEGEYYLKYLIPQKYNLEVNNVKTNYDCSSFFACFVDNYEVSTSNGTFIANLVVQDNKIIETDNYANVYISQLLHEDLISYMSLNNYIIKPYIINSYTNLTDVSNININNLNNETSINFTVIIKKDSRLEEEMKQIANKMIEWYKNHKVYGSTNFILFNNEEYEKATENNYNLIKYNYNISNLVSCKIKANGDVEIN